MIPTRPNWEPPEHVAGNGLSDHSPKVYQSYIKDGNYGVQGFERRWFVVRDPEEESAWGVFRNPDKAMDEAERLQKGA